MVGIPGSRGSAACTALQRAGQRTLQLLGHLAFRRLERLLGCVHGLLLLNGRDLQGARQ